jgi:hypothetical protein
VDGDFQVISTVISFVIITQDNILKDQSKCVGLVQGGQTASSIS